MARDFEILELSPLRGIDRNKAGGDDPDQVQLAHEAYNLAPDRRGALTMFGRLKPLHYPEGPLRVPGELIGFDERGFSSFAETITVGGEEGPGALQRIYHLFDGDTILTSRTPGYVPPDNTDPTGSRPGADGAHIHGFGAYRSRRRFFGYDDNAAARQVEPFDLAPIIAERDGGEASMGVPEPASPPLIALAVDTGNSRWMTIEPTGRTFTTSPLGDAWAEQGNANGTPGVIFRTLAFGDGVWVAAGNGGARFSDDNGATWQVPVTAGVASGNVWKVMWSGVMFVASVGNQTNAAGDGLWVSPDGETWTFAENLGPDWMTAGFAFSAIGYGLAISTSASGGSRRAIFRSENGGGTWVETSPGVHLARPPITNIVGGRLESFWLMDSNGAVYFMPDARNSPTSTTQVWAGGSNHAKSGWYDSQRDRWYLVMRNGDFYESEDGLALRRVDTMGLDPIVMVGEYAPQLVMSSEEGIVVAGNDGGAGALRVIDATFGLDAGTYDVYYVTSVSTESGLLVVDLGHRRIQFSDAFGSSITVTMPSLASILAGMAWVDTDTPDPEQVAQATEMLTNRTFVDIYVGHTTETPGDVDESEADPLQDSFPVFMGSLQPHATAPESLSVRSAPVGRVLGGGEPVMTMGLGDVSMSNGATPVREAIIHQGRVWGLASRDSQAYHLARSDFGEAEAAKVRGGATLIFSDIGYVNLMRQQSYVRLIPTESDQFVGLVSTPSGILAFFTNEAQLISGDPIDNSLSVELYPARVGADPGTRVTKIGGVAYSVWKGDIYMIWGGQAQPLSRPAYLGEDPFVNVIADTTYRSLVAQTESGKVFRYFVEHDMWFENTLQPVLVSSAVEPELKVILPNVDYQGARYLIERPLHATDGEVWLVVREEVVPPMHELDVAPDTPYVVWRRIDYGNKNRVDATYGALVPVQGEFADDAGPVYPLLDWRILSQDEPIVTEYPFFMWPTSPNQRVTARRNEDTFFFYLPRGRKSRTADLALILRGMQMFDILEPQVQVEWVPGHTSRRAPEESDTPAEGEGGEEGDDPIIIM